MGTASLCSSALVLSGQFRERKREGLVVARERRVQVRACCNDSPFVSAANEQARRRGSVLRPSWPRWSCDVIHGGRLLDRHGPPERGQIASWLGRSSGQQ